MNPSASTSQTPSPRTVLVTGATRGLGLAIAHALDDVDDVALVLAVRDLDAGQRVVRSLRRPARLVSLDMASLAAVSRFAADWREPLWALVNNAGLQITGPTSLSGEGIETTLAVNHLGPTRLALGLLPWLRGGRVFGIGSGTHNPEHRGARVFGFRGGRFTSIAALARGEVDADNDQQRGMDRYATSKLLTTVTAMELARRFPETTFATFDPGLMPGTGLARSAPWWGRLAWATLMRWLVPVLPDASTPVRSAAAARQLLLRDDLISGEVYDFAGQLSRRVWSGARDPELSRRVLDETCAFLDARWPLPAVPAASAGIGRVREAV